MHRSLILVMALTLLLAGTIAADTPQLINYQGTLLDSGGATVPDDTYLVSFAIFDAAFGGESKWSEVQSVITIDGGFTVRLGSTVSIHDSVFSGVPRFLSVTFDGEELEPRTMLVTIPWSFRTATIDGATGGALTEGLSIAVDELVDGNAIIITNLSGDTLFRAAIDQSSTSVAIWEVGEIKGELGATGETKKVELNQDGITVFGATEADTSVLIGVEGGIRVTVDELVDGNALVITNGSGDTTFRAAIDQGKTSVAIWEVGEIKGGAGAATGNKKVEMNETGFTVFGATESDTAANLSTDGNIQATGSLVVGVPSGTTGELASSIGYNNLASGDTATVGGGANNTASGTFALIDGGSDNIADDTAATVGGGRYNYARGKYSVIAGGGSADPYDSNSISDLGESSVISGGRRNNITGNICNIGGGWQHNASGTASVIGGGEANNVSGFYATVGGGRYNSASDGANTVAGGTNNAASNGRATVGGGGWNNASAIWSTVGGGQSNDATGENSVVSGGWNNTADGDESTIGGGLRNSASNTYATVGGGAWNFATGLISTVGGGQYGYAIGSFSSIGGGGYNFARGDFSVIAGGGGGASSVSDSNSAQGDLSAILGGNRNVTTGSYGVVAGGRDNESDSLCFSAGHNAKATHSSSWVWSDDAAQTNSFGANTFTARASGGVRFYSSTDTTTGVSLTAGAGAWQTLSDRNSKTNINEVDYGDILDKIDQLPINEWNYKSQDESIRHIGPMAQDFHRLFGVGEDNKHLSTIDPDGVALAAIKALRGDNAKQAEQIEQLLKRVAELEKTLGE